jgi:hypothetical protein
MGVNTARTLYSVQYYQECKFNLVIANTNKNNVDQWHYINVHALNSLSSPFK